MRWVLDCIQEVLYSGVKGPWKVGPQRTRRNGDGMPVELLVVDDAEAMRRLVEVAVRDLGSVTVAASKAETSHCSIRTTST